MKKILLSLAAFATLALAACSSVSTKVETGAIKASTFNFVNGGASADAAFADRREATHSTIQAAIAKDLNAKGLTKVDSGGDVTVAYLVLVGDNTGIETINTYFGYNDDTAALSDKAFLAYTGSKNPNHFQAGTILIDIVDGKTFKLLKRNYAVRPVLKNPTDAERAANIQSAVDEALSGLTIKK